MMILLLSCIILYKILHCTLGEWELRCRLDLDSLFGEVEAVNVCSCHATLPKC